MILQLICLTINIISLSLIFAEYNDYFLENISDITQILIVFSHYTILCQIIKIFSITNDKYKNAQEVVEIIKNDKIIEKIIIIVYSVG